MATFVNDLRLTEIATGDESGTWGTTTNTNLELIAEAFSYGTEASFSSDADTTTTIADGASDPVRSLYLKVTSGVSLTATRTLTIAPNTVSKVWIIENATSGSQSINISQGSGANVTIPNGDVMVVYSDGAGAGAAVVDAFTNLLVSSGLEVDGTFTFGTANSTLADNNLRFKSSGDAFIDHNTVGQDINFRVSNASSLDTTALTVVSSGNIGIGTATVTSIAGFSRAVKLENASSASYVVSGGTDEAEFAVSSSGGWLGTSTNVAQRFVTNNSERARIGTTGQFDITPNTGVTAINLKDGGTGGTNYGFIGGGNALKSGGSANDFSFRSDTGHIDFYTGGQNLRFRVNSAGAVEVKSNSLLVNSAVKADSEVTTFYGSTNNTKAVSMFNNRGSGSFYVMQTFYKGTTPTLVGRVDWDDTGGFMTFTNISDGRLKNVTGEARGLDLINKLNPVKYYFKDNDWESEGLVAQEVEQAYKDLGDTPVGVRTPESDDDYYQLSTNHFVVNLIKAVKELSAEVDELKRKVN
jgi:hypothetical protein